MHVHLQPQQVTEAHQNIWCGGVSDGALQNPTVPTLSGVYVVWGRVRIIIFKKRTRLFGLRVLKEIMEKSSKKMREKRLEISREILKKCWKKRGRFVAELLRISVENDTEDQEYLERICRKYLREMELFLQRKSEIFG